MESLPLHDEKHLLELIAKDDTSAFRILYDHYWSKVFALAHRKTGSSPDAEEIVQDIFTDLWQRRSNLLITKGISNYLSIAVKYKVMDWLDKQMVRKKHLANEYALNRTETPSLPDELRIQELKEQIAALTNGLPEKCRLVFQLSRDEGMNHQEIARVLNISTKTVESHLARAIRSFRTGLQNFLSFF
jgi:RNA polymerase sigma-70 factor (ECF subfamily)